MKTTDTLAWLLIGALAAVTAVSARAQEQEQGAAASAQDARADAPAVAGEVRRSGFLPAIQVVESYDDNVFLSTTNHHGDVVTDVIGVLNYARVGPRWQFRLRYTPEFNLYRTNSFLNYVSQSYFQDIGYRLSSKTDLRWMFDASRYPSRGITSSGALSLNSASSAQQTQQQTQGIEQGQEITAGDTSLGLTRRMSEHSRLGVTLNGSLRSFSTDQSVAVPDAINERTSSLGGSLSWDTQVSATRTLGVSAGYTYFAFPRTNTHNSYQSIDLRMTQKLPHQLQLVMAAGPSWQELPGTNGAETLPGYDLLVSLTGNAGQLSSWTASYAKTVQVSLLPNSLASQVFSAQYQHKWSRRWMTTALFGYTRSLSTTGAGALDGFSGTAQVAYQLNRGSRLFASYQRTQQTTAIPSTQFNNLEQSRLSVGFAYEFAAAPLK
jgi:hypothetical protein